jgi:hypothetical protein
MEIWLKLLAAHFIGDFAFQSTWMSMEKGKSWEVLFYHAATYVATFILLGFGLSAWGFALLFISHYIIDACKSRYKLIETIWMDQAWHIVVLGVVWYFLGTCSTILCK